MSAIPSPRHERAAPRIYRSIAHISCTATSWAKASSTTKSRGAIAVFACWWRQPILLMMNHKHRNLGHRFAIALFAVSISACAVGNPPIEQTSQVVATPIQGELSVAVNKSPAVGAVTPVDV